MKGIEYRKAQEKDAKRLVRLRADVWNSTYKGIIDEGYLESLSFPLELLGYEKAWKGYIEKSTDSAHSVFVALSQGEIVGFGSCEVRKVTSGREKLIGKIGDIHTLYVDDDFQSAGIGSELFNLLLGDLKERGCKKAIIGVLEGNDKAADFYKKKGGRNIGKKIEDVGMKKHTVHQYMISIT